SFTEGLHFVHVRAKDGTNRWSAVHTQVFYKLPGTGMGENKISAYRYWFDDLFGSQQYVDLSSEADVFDLVTDIDLPSDFAKGETHIIHFQSKDLLGRWSVVHTDTFVINLSTMLHVESQDLKVYPNPFDSYLTIENIAGKAIQQMSIMDATGRIVFSSEMIQSQRKLIINTLSELSPGIYALRYQLGTELYHRKLLKH
ncbi:MAG: T9SS type A sorting domain-containing protein, partial [Paludibacteraceae bacterium]|nr:T9SS type A sorting domain-containing protein [Paludibacteraceae bacterium]